MLATGGSAPAAIEVLKQWGAHPHQAHQPDRRAGRRAAVAAAHPDVAIHPAALDRQLNEQGYIMPGLGDAGDRQFGTGSQLDGYANVSTRLRIRLGHRPDVRFR